MLKIISPYAPTDRMLPSAEAHRVDLCHFFRLLNTRNSAMQVCFLLHFSVTQERIGRNIFRQKLLKYAYLYIYTGNGDELEEMIFESTEMLYELLEESFYPYDRMNEVILFENAHNEKSWREIFPDFSTHF